MRPVILDGPCRGSSIEMDDDTHIYKIPVPIPLSIQDLLIDKMEPAFNEVTYYIHLFRFGSHCIMTASVNPVQPNAEDAFDLILTAYAKEAER